MATLLQTAKKVRSFNFNKAILIVVKDNEAYMLDLNTDEQLFKKGIDSLGQELAEYRSSDYAALKRILNPSGATDLKLEGDFHESFFIDAKAFPIIIDARDGKTPGLVKKYGEDLFGLTLQSLSDFNKHILPDVQLKLRNGVL